MQSSLPVLRDCKMTDHSRKTTQVEQCQSLVEVHANHCCREETSRHSNGSSN
jgi:hypothetical protein